MNTYENQLPFMSLEKVLLLRKATKLMRKNAYSASGRTYSEKCLSLIDKRLMELVHAAMSSAE